MSITAEALEDLLRADLDSIVTDLIRFHGLKYERDRPDLSDPLLRWLDFTLRFVEPKPRPVLRAQCFSALLSPEAQLGMEAFEAQSMAGGDLNRFQGVGIIRRHDVSGKKNAQRTDQLWADWRILHFHLNDQPILPGQYFGERCDRLLFAMVTTDAVLAIDVRDHSAFADRDLIEGAIRSWPALFKAMTRSGVSLEQDISAEDRRKLRQCGVNVVDIVVDGKAYLPPGMGLSTAGTSNHVGDTADFIRRALRMLCQSLASDTPFVPLSLSGEPHRLVITRRGLALQAERDTFMHLLPRSEAPNVSAWSKAHRLVLPDWVLARVTPELPSLDAT